MFRFQSLLLRSPKANDVKVLPTFLLNGMEVLAFMCHLLGKDTSGTDEANSQLLISRPKSKFPCCPVQSFLLSNEETETKKGT